MLFFAVLFQELTKLFPRKIRELVVFRFVKGAYADKYIYILKNLELRGFLRTDLATSEKCRQGRDGQ